MKKIVYFCLLCGITYAAFPQGTQINGSPVYHYNGNVGIGISSPSAKLDVLNGDIELMQITGVLDNSSGTIKFGENNTRLFAIQYDGALGNPNNKLMVRGSTGADDSYNLNHMAFDQVGNVGIGTVTPTEKLSVDGTVLAKRVRVSLDGSDWPDFVFTPSHQLRSLEELEGLITENNHLPEVLSAKTIGKEGLDLGKMDATLLQKIEELTLYLIEMNKNQQRLIKEVEMLQQENEELRKNTFDKR